MLRSISDDSIRQLIFNQRSAHHSKTIRVNSRYPRAIIRDAHIRSHRFCICAEHTFQNHFVSSWLIIRECPQALSFVILTSAFICAHLRLTLSGSADDNGDDSGLRVEQGCTPLVTLCVPAFLRENNISSSCERKILVGAKRPSKTLDAKRQL